MIKFVWKDNDDIGYYECTMYDDSNKLESIYFWDFSNPYNVENDNKHRYNRNYAYKVGYCNGYSMDKGFDKTEDPDQFGYVGKPRHTIDDIKRWCENYLASMYIREYEDIQVRFDIIKERAEQLKKMGYTSEEDIDI